jgi:hypothetical protein
VHFQIKGRGWRSIPWRIDSWRDIRELCVEEEEIVLEGGRRRGHTEGVLKEG